MNILARLGQSAPTEIKALARLKNPGSLWQPYGTNNNSFSNLPYLGMGGELTRQSEQFDINKLCGEPLNNGVVAACVNAICKALPDAPLILENKTKNGWQAVDDHDCLYPLRHPNDDHSDADIWGLTSGFKATRGQAFWVLIPNNGGTVGEVHVWNPDRVTIQSSETEFISGYRIQRENGGFFDAPKNQVIHFRHLPNFHNPRIGWNPLNTGRSQIAGDNLSATYHTSILFNAGVISLLIGVREGVAQGSVTTEQFEKVLTNIRKANRERAGGIEGFNLPFEIHKLAYSPDEMLIEKLIEYYETRICSVMGVSQRVAGLGADPTYNNLAEALNDFWERRIVPDRNSDAATLNRQWLPLWGMDSNDWRFRFDYSNVPALQENKDELHKRAREDYKAGAMDLRQYRVLIGYSTNEEATEAQFEGVFYAPPKNSQPDNADESLTGKAETKSYDPNQPRDKSGRWGNGDAFESMHKWEGGKMPSNESPAYQEGKAKAVDALKPYTAPRSLEAATIVVRQDGTMSKVATGTRDNVQINIPGNKVVAHLHSHTDEAAHSEGDWAMFVATTNVEQAHVVTPTKTYSLHKPPGWKAEDHGFKTISPLDTEDEQMAKLNDNEDHFLDTYAKANLATGVAGRSNWKELSYKAANEEMARKTGIIFRTGTR